jgi:hypothetical protein
MFIYLAGGEAVQVENVSNFVFARGADLVYLVAQDDDRALGELLVVEQRLKLVYGLVESLSVPGID